MWWYYNDILISCLINLLINKTASFICLLPILIFMFVKGLLNFFQLKKRFIFLSYCFLKFLSFIINMSYLSVKYGLF